MKSNACSKSSISSNKDKKKKIDMKKKKVNKTTAKDIDDKYVSKEKKINIVKSASDNSRFIAKTQEYQNYDSSSESSYSTEEDNEENSVNVIRINSHRIRRRRLNRPHESYVEYNQEERLPNLNVEEKEEEAFHEEEVHNWSELRGFMHSEIANSREVVKIRKKDFQYRGTNLLPRMNQEYRRSLIKFATLMPVEDDRDIPLEEMITIESADFIRDAIDIRQETKFREVNNMDNKGLIIKCNSAMLRVLSAWLYVEYTDDDGVRNRLSMFHNVTEMIDSIPYASVVNQLLLKVAYVLETAVNKAFTHKKDRSYTSSTSSCS
jgi:hypothetical protein